MISVATLRKLSDFAKIAILVLCCSPQLSYSISVSEGESGWFEINPNSDQGYVLRAVGRLRVSGSSCTAVPVSRDIFLTAAHCGANGAPVTITTYQLQNLWFEVFERTGLRPTFSTTFTGVLRHHPSYNGASSAVQANDIAVVELDNQLPPDHHVFRPYPFEPPFGGVVTIAGFGIFGTGEVGSCIRGAGMTCNPTYPSAPSLLRTGVNVLESFGASFPNTVSIDFDAPPTAGWQGNPYGGRDPVSIDLSKGGTRFQEAITTNGDSGGPLFYNPAVSLSYRRNSLPPGVPIKAKPYEFYLLGITSYGTDASFEWGTRRCQEPWNVFSLGTCETPARYNEGRHGTYGDNATYTLVKPFLTWISQFDATITATNFQESPALVVPPVARVTQDLYTDIGLEIVESEPTLSFPVNASNYCNLDGAPFRVTIHDPRYTQWFLQVGHVPGGSDVYSSGLIEPGTDAEIVRHVPGIQIDGRDVFTTIRYRAPGEDWRSVSEVFSTASERCPPENGPWISSPNEGTVLTPIAATNEFPHYHFELNLGFNVSPSQEAEIVVNRYPSGFEIYRAPAEFPVSRIKTSDIAWAGEVLITLSWEGKTRPYFFFTDEYASALEPRMIDFDFPGSNHVFEWEDRNWKPENYWLYVGSSIGARDYFDSGLLAKSNSAFVENLPVTGEDAYVRLYYKRQGTGWQFMDRRFSFSNQGGQPPSFVSPHASELISGPETELVWKDNGQNIDEWWVYLGSSDGSNDYFDSGPIGRGVTSVVVNGYPRNGTSVAARLFYRRAGQAWQFTDELFSVADDLTTYPVLVAPAPENDLPGGTVSFDWTANGSSVAAYWLRAGSSTGTNDYHDSGRLNANVGLSHAVSNLPSDGSTVHVRLYYQLTGSNKWHFSDTTYTANDSGTGPPGASMLLSPSGSGTGTTPTYSWKEVESATYYWLWVESPAGTPVIKKWYTTALANCDGTTCSVTPSTGINTSSKWWVQTWSPLGVGPWSKGLAISP